jgi:DNA segregation ATPase FtsK/SpoIIIE-like protein
MDRRELTGVALLFAAVFLAGALIAPGNAPGIHCWSATGAFGPVGSCARSAIFDLIGPIAALITPLFLVLYGVRALGRIDHGFARTWRAFGVGLVVLVAVAAALTRGAVPWSAQPHPRPDLIGGFSSWVLLHTVGLRGAWVLLALAFCVLVTVTLARNPIRALFSGLRRIARANIDDDDGVSAPRPAKTIPAPRRTQPAPRYELPPRDLFAVSSASTGQDSGQLDVIGYRLTGALRSLKFEGLLVGRATGPAVTRFEVDPAPGLRLREVAAAGVELAAAMKLSSARIVAPIPGKGTVGFEVPNPAPQTVSFRSMMDSPDYANPAFAMPVLLGRDLDNRPVVADLAKMPHLLIAGGAASGKSMCLNTFIASLVYRHTPSTLRLLLIESGQADLSAWSSLPHLRHPIIHDTRDAVAAIEWAALEVEQRGRTLVEAGARNVREYNERVPAKSMPYIVLMVNEIESLISSDEGVEGPLAMLAQRGRAAGIHVVLATAKPNANVVTALIKANFPSRIALKLSSALDSRRMLDGIGAESLIGQGDMLYVAPGKSEPARLQGTYMSEDETRALADWFGTKVSTGAIREGDLIEEMRALEAPQR